MQSSSLPVPFLAFLLAVNTLTSCSSPASNGNANVSTANSTTVSKVVPKDNVEELAMVVKLPFEPEEVAWEEKAADGSLTAVIRFSPENAEKMSAEVAKNGAPTPERLTVETWYPAELIAQSEMSGESTVEGKSYPAGPFLNPPYTKGKITRIDNTDYFILQISS
jgi:hypothetical protein